MSYLSIHDLTRRSTPIPCIIGDSDCFQFTTSQGGRPASAGIVIVTLHLSIHDLTRRSTRLHAEIERDIYLSIHDLTRRSTLAFRKSLAIYDLSIHDLTRRSTRWRWYMPVYPRSFNSRPHKEVDNGSPPEGIR